MIRLSFITGGAVRKVLINNRKITMISQETGFTPLIIDLDKLDKTNVKGKVGEDGLKILKEISKLNSEEEMAKDIIKDFQSTGWRLVKRE